MRSFVQCGAPVGSDVVELVRVESPWVGVTDGHLLSMRTGVKWRGFEVLVLSWRNERNEKAEIKRHCLMDHAGCAVRGTRWSLEHVR